MSKMKTLGAAALWFGASISIAEILTGALLAPLGFVNGVIAIVIGHLIGGVLFYLVGLVGANNKKGAMESTAVAFGRVGSVFFSVLNVLQLIGWTAVMIVSGATAVGSVFGEGQMALWCLLIGVLIAVWVIAGLKNVAKLNIVAVTALFLMCVILGFTVFGNGVSERVGDVMSFGLALELSIAMPVSWLPLVADYTKDSESPARFTLVSVVSYTVGSIFMYIIGLGASLYAGTSDVVGLLMGAGLGVVATLTVILSTVTTTFLDVHSAGESVVNIFERLKSKSAGLTVCAIGTILAIFTPIGQYENFLILIGSVFVPMAAVMIADYFLNKGERREKRLNVTNAILWGVGFGLYHVFLNVDTPLGSTVMVVLITLALCAITYYIRRVMENNV